MLLNLQQQQKKKQEVSSCRQKDAQKHALGCSRKNWQFNWAEGEDGAIWKGLWCGDLQ